MNNQYIKGTWRLTALLFRQHRLRILLWLVGILGISLAVALAYPEIYTTQEDIMGFALTMENPAMSALIGANYATDDFNIGVIYASEMLLFTGIAVSIMNILLVKATTREDEEKGRLEIVQSLPVGKVAYLTASLSLMVFINLGLVLLLTVGLSTLGTDVFTWESSFLYSSILGSIGLFFAGVTAVSAQLSDTTHGTTILSLGFLILSYIIRVIGDVQNNTLSLFSPLGWVTRTNVFAVDDWRPVLVLLGGSVLLILGAFYLNAKRDMFAGILPNRPGQAHASRLLRTAPGFVLNLEKGKIIGWFFLIFLLSAAFGGILGDLETYFADMDIVQAFLQERSGSNLTEQFIALLIQIMTIFSMIPGVMILHSLKNEEAAGRIEHFYTRAVSRNKILATYFILALVTVIILQLAIVLGLYSTASMVLDESLDLAALIGSALSYIPAILIVLGITAFFIGLLPRFSLVSWIYIVFMFVVLYLADILEFPDGVNSMSALHHIPAYPHESINWFNFSVMLGIGLLFTLIGFIGYNKRDIQA